MSEMAPESGGGSFLTRKYGGIPAWVFLAGAAVLAYLYFRHSQSAAATTSGIKTTGGGGSASTGKTVVRKGAVTINVKQSPRTATGDDDDQQPKPPHPPKGGGDGADIDFHEITIQQARALRKRLGSPRVWYGKAGGEKLQIPSGGSYEKYAAEGTGKLYTTEYNYDKYLKGKGQ